LAFGTSRVIWVVGAQKVVADLDAAFERITVLIVEEAIGF
jgi:hypothetical protein